ncbi:MAG: FadR/GntR family transcriptional regulator [Anaerostipes sp.]|nr:FadR/GntR family transcriptional regulator [Anaerostipes sp.]
MQKNSKKTYEYVFEYFSEQILSGKLKLNDKIPPERDIAETLNVSRNSVREVMHMLEITGLIECLQGSGNYVRCQPEEYMFNSVHMVMALLDIDYLEIFHIRCGYEYTALKLAVENATQEDLDKLYNVLVKMDEALSIKESAQLDIEFHKILVEASHNRMLILYSSMIGNLSDVFIKDLRSKILVDKRRAESLQKAHREIYQAIVDKEHQKGREAMEQHFDIVGAQVMKIQEKR